MTDKAN